MENEPDSDILDNEIYIQSLYEFIADRYTNWSGKIISEHKEDSKTLMKQWIMSNYLWNPKSSLKKNLINYASTHYSQNCNIPLDLRYQINLRKYIIKLMPLYDPYSTLGHINFDLNIIGDIEKEKEYKSMLYYNGIVLLKSEYILEDPDYEYNTYIDGLREYIMNTVYYKYHLAECKQFKPRRRLISSLRNTLDIQTIKQVLGIKNDIKLEYHVIKE